MHAKWPNSSVKIETALKGAKMGRICHVLSRRSGITRDRNRDANPSAFPSLRVSDAQDLEFMRMGL
jgi:hypothetical protein